MNRIKYSQPTFVNCGITNDSLVSFDTNIDCLYARAYLKENGMESVQFVKNNPPNIYDLADDILSLANDIIIFYINEYNFYLSKIITHEIKKIDPNNRIIYFGPMLTESFEYVLNNTQADLCILSNPEKNICELLKSDYEDYHRLSGIAMKFDGEILVNADASSADYIPSPYITRLISANSAQTFGILVSRSPAGGGGYCISIECLQKDLEFIFDAIPKKNICLNLICDDISNYPYFFDLQNVLPNFPFTYRCRTNVQYITNELICELFQLNFIKIDVIIDSDKYFSADLDWIDILQGYAGKNIKFSFVFNFDVTEISRMNVIKTIGSFIQNDISSSEDFIFRGTGISSPKVYPKRNAIINDSGLLSMINKDKYPSSLFNGFMSFMTGLYQPMALNNSAKHVGIPNSPISSEQMEALKEYIGINSAIVAPLLESREPKSDISFYSEGDNIIRSLNQTYDNSISNAYNNNFYLPHLYSVKSDINQDFELIFDDFNTASPVQFSRMPYAQAASKSSEGISLLSIENNDDLEIFLNNVEYFISSGMFGNLYEVTHYIKDICRWSPPVSCSVCKLPRFRLDNDGLIFPCGGCGKSIGSVHDSYFKAYQQTYIVSEEAQIDRNCSGCQVKNECSKCCFLPDFLQPDRFCEIMKKQPYINLYIRTKSSLNILMQYSIFKSTNLSDISISNKYVSQLIPGELIPDETSETRDECLQAFIYLFHAKSGHYIFNASTRKVFGINETMAIIMEFLQRGANSQMIKAFLSEKCGLKEDDANKKFAEAIGLLTESGCLWRMVI